MGSRIVQEQITSQMSCETLEYQYSDRLQRIQIKAFRGLFDESIAAKWALLVALGGWAFDYPKGPNVRQLTLNLFLNTENSANLVKRTTQKARAAVISVTHKQTLSGTLYTELKGQEVPHELWMSCTYFKFVVLASCAFSFAFLAKPSFSRLKQETASLFREQQGGTLRVPEEQTTKKKLRISSEDARLTSILRLEGRRGSWRTVWQAWKSYTGSAICVYTAAMQAAYNCRRYIRGAEIYDKMRSLPPEEIEVDSVSLQIAMKVFGKLGNQSRIDEIWEEVLENKWFGMLTAGSRLEAAAEMGDVTKAGKLLKEMSQSRIATNINHYNSVLNACKNSKPPSYRAAQAVFESLRDLRMQPTVVTFTNLVQSHREAPLSRIQDVMDHLGKSELEIDKVFAEAYVSSLFWGRLKRDTDLSGFQALLLEMSEERRSELNTALEAFATLGVMTGLCRTAKFALTQLMLSDVESRRPTRPAQACHAFAPFLRK
ncbi:unnamed protein product [Symbiodinium sp. KB8]|nr:unnamed protein product [Symbiodinium sp. KB8]